MNSQHQKILDILSDGDWHCTSEMRSEYMADPPKRLQELRDEKGYLFYTPRYCTRHNYHKGGVKEWRLLTKDQNPPVSSPEPPRQEIPPKTTQTTTQTGYAYDKPVKTFMEAFEEERKRKGAPLTKAEMNLLAKKFK